MSQHRSVTLRSVLLGLLLIPFNDYWIVQLEVVRYSFPTYAVPFYNVIFTLLLLTLGNLGVKRVAPRKALTGAELITVYVLLSVSSALCSTNMMQVLVSSMGHAAWFASEENQWKRFFLKEIPQWLTVNDMKALKGYYNGQSSLYEPGNLRAWLRPVAAWSLFIFVLLTTMLCLMTLLQKRWMEDEHLAFPIIQLPLQMTLNADSFFRNRVLWMGFLFSAVVTLWNGLNVLYPFLPVVPIKRQTIGNLLFTQPPWNALGGLRIAFYLFGIGLGFLMPVDLSFSCWVFFLLGQLQLVASKGLGLTEKMRFPYSASQSFGAYLCICVLALWAARGHLAYVFRLAGSRAETQDRAEASRYRCALLGVFGGFTLLEAFSVAAGLRWWVGIVFFLVYFSLALMIARIRAELGFPVHDMHEMSADQVLTSVYGSHAFPVRDLTVFSLFHWFNRTYASHPIPHELEGLKIAEETRIGYLGMSAAILLATIVGTLVCFWVLLDTYYRLGAQTGKFERWAVGHGAETWGRLESWVRQPTPHDTWAGVFILVGFGVAYTLAQMRYHWLGFPLHPLAYAVAPSWGMQQLWVCLFIASATKFFVLRYSGLRGYRKIVPFFMGLILGEFTGGAFWSLYGILRHIPTYDFWP